VITRLYNLECEDGHKFFSPDPKPWVGKECRATLEEGKKCDRKLRRIKK